MQNRMVLMMPEQSCRVKRHGHSQHVSHFYGSIPWKPSDGKHCSTSVNLNRIQRVAPYMACEP